MSDKHRIATSLVLCFFAAIALPCGLYAATLESEITGFVHRVYAGNDIRITFSSLPQQARGEVKVTSLGFTKVPDVNGDGICLAGIEGRTGVQSNIYVPFKVLIKKKLYIARCDIPKGGAVHRADLDERESFLNGAGADYPSGIEEILTKTAKKEIPAGEIVINQLLESPVAVQKGELVNIRAENSRLVVEGKGTALDKGKVGDVVRVKSLSGKEVLGRITGNNVVAVDF